MKLGAGEAVTGPRRRRRFWHATLRLCSTTRRHHPPRRAVLSQICCFGERKVVLFQILLDGPHPMSNFTFIRTMCHPGGTKKHFWTIEYSQYQHAALSALWTGLLAKITNYVRSVKSYVFFI